MGVNTEQTTEGDKSKNGRKVRKKKVGGLRSEGSYYPLNFSEHFMLVET
jgi:hypothetical protein